MIPVSGECPWKEYTSENGKVYFHNTATKESVWTIPKELAELKEKIEKEAKEKEEKEKQQKEQKVKVTFELPGLTSDGSRKTLRLPHG